MTSVWLDDMVLNITMPLEVLRIQWRLTSDFQSTWISTFLYGAESDTIR